MDKTISGYHILIRLHNYCGSRGNRAAWRLENPVRDQVVKQLKVDENPSFLSNLNPVFDFFGQLFRF